ncbi:MAG: guanylate kinase [Gammaproteobacteria bacterium]|nr:MAG: guanylate kinase [Gammaproteobacteria bacterium]RLA14268.1 MAG: guanylate kinase [Gammaproteobacteria bacterium]
MTFSCLFVVSGPSGVGKTSLVSALTDKHPTITCPVSYTTRPPRPGEQEGTDYHFVSLDQFETMVTDNEFLEHAHVFGNQYGTSRRAVEQQLNHGETVLLEIDWQGAAQARRLFPDAITVMILPPSIQKLRLRLNHRQQDENDEIEQRMLAATRELSHYADFDYLIINDNFDLALQELSSVLAASSLRRCAQQEKIKRLLPELN